MSKLNSSDDLRITIETLVNDLDDKDAEEDDFNNILERVKSIPKILQECYFENDEQKEQIKKLLLLLSYKTDKLRDKLNNKAKEVSSKINDIKETNRILKRYGKATPSLKK